VEIISKLNAAYRNKTSNNSDPRYDHRNPSIIINKSIRLRPPFIVIFYCNVRIIYQPLLRTCSRKAIHSSTPQKSTKRGILDECSKSLKTVDVRNYIDHLNSAKKADQIKTPFKYHILFGCWENPINKN
ncbi:hypothetical protein V8G54_032787, partial [Vigna mungo]